MKLFQRLIKEVYGVRVLHCWSGLGEGWKGYEWFGVWLSDECGGAGSEKMENGGGEGHLWHCELFMEVEGSVLRWWTREKMVMLYDDSDEVDGSLGEIIVLKLLQT